VKETDRIAAMATELRKLGASVLEGADCIEVTPPAAWRAAAIHTYDDHRMAMCFSLAAFNPLANPAGHAALRIEDPACVAKTFPDYFEELFSLASADPDDVPVITVDGPSASGKGTLAQAVAERLGYHLPTRALYATALPMSAPPLDPMRSPHCGAPGPRFEAGRIAARPRRDR
jgi:3-phosphoshikimate 1-carboxyvinyltransferase